jgi:hypothetical protein
MAISLREKGVLSIFGFHGDPRSSIIIDDNGDDDDSDNQSFNFAKRKNWPRAKVDFSISKAASLPIVRFIYPSLFLADASYVLSFLVSPSRFSRSALDTPGRCQIFILMSVEEER